MIKYNFILNTFVVLSCRLYKQMFIPDAEHQTLAIIGVAKIQSHVAPWEMQARVAAEVFAGRCVLPSNEEMLAECIARERQLVKIGRPKEKFLNVSPLPF